nr:GNAT family N-acetyltransferase [Skermanella pratensis]
MDGDLDVMRFVGGLPASMEEHGIVLTDRIAKTYPPGLGYWSVFPKVSPEQFLGWVLLMPLDKDDPVSDVEIGWRLVRSAWGHGYAPKLRRPFCTTHCNPLASSGWLRLFIRKTSNPSAWPRRSA